MEQRDIDICNKRHFAVPNKVLFNVSQFCWRPSNLFLALPTTHVKQLVLRRAAADGKLRIDSSGFRELKAMGILRLRLSSDTKITTLEPLRVLTNLTHLKLSYMWNVTSLEPLRTLTSLRHLELTDLRLVKSLEPLQTLVSLQDLKTDIRKALS